MYNLVINDDKSITIEKDGVTITLTKTEFEDIDKEVNTELYYREAVVDHITDEMSGYDVVAILADEQLMNNMVKYYANLRFENDGGDPDEMMDWTECMDETMGAFEDELEEYLIEE